MRINSLGCLILLVGLAACDGTDISHANTEDAGPPLFCGPGTVQTGRECIVAPDAGRAGTGNCKCASGVACPEGDLARCVIPDGGLRGDAGPGVCKCADGATCPDGDLSNCPSGVDAGHKEDAGPRPDAGTCTLQVRAYIDGESQLNFKAGSVWWQNQSQTVPGLSAGPAESLDSATTLTTCDTSGKWCPTWTKTGVDCDSCTSKENCATGVIKSSEFNSITPALPAVAQDVTLRINRAVCTDDTGATVNCCRGSCGILQQPSAANDYTAIININDERIAGAAWYDVTLFYLKQ